MAPAVTSDLDDVQHARTRADAVAALAGLFKKYGVKYEKGVACLTKDEKAMRAFFDFSDGHWGLLRISTPIDPPRTFTRTVGVHAVGCHCTAPYGAHQGRAVTNDRKADGVHPFFGQNRSNGCASKAKTSS